MQRRQFSSLVSLACLLSLVWAGCAPAPKIVPPAEPETKPVQHSQPVHLALVSGDQKIMVRWKVEGSEIISGYDVFINESEPSVSATHANSSEIKPFNDQVYPGDTNPDDDVVEFPAEGLRNGVKYFVWVRIVRPDGSLSEPTAVETAVCGPRGEFILGERYHSKNDGFSLLQGKVVAADASSNDLYLFQMNGKFYFGSPSRLNGYLRATKFQVTPIGTNEEQIKQSIQRSKTLPSEEKVQVISGTWVWLLTADGYQALLHVGNREGNEVRLTYSLCPLEGERSF